VVFTVNEDNTLATHEVVLGEVQGSMVMVTDGVTPNMIIVRDARGLQNGQKVEVIQN
jgi:hypothetical protein